MIFYFMFECFLQKFLQIKRHNKFLSNKTHMHNLGSTFHLFLKFLWKILIRNIIIINQDFDLRTKRKFDILVQHSHFLCVDVQIHINFFLLLSTTLEINVYNHLLIDSRYVLVYRSSASILIFFVSYMHALVTKMLVALCFYHLMVIHLVKPTNNQHRNLIPSFQQITLTHIQENQLSLVLI